MDGNYFKNKFKVNSARLPDWDYSWPGYYYFTICTKDRQDFFGEIKNGIVGLNDLGCVVWKCWNELPKHFTMCILDEFIVMPNHIHGIIQIIELCRDAIYRVSDKNRHEGDAINRVSTNGGFAGHKNPMLSHSLSSMIRRFKGRSTFEIHNSGHNDFSWQPRFHDHIVRIDTEALGNIRFYIRGNPARWDEDGNNIDRK